ncbi:MAG: hypothetical protein OXB88_07325, partial [Bacteriovoracales bacterium]|nr:hypothetical protein [Bacteriovoracales bacterium]
GKTALIHFERIVLPGGEEVYIQGEALEARGRSPGIKGVLHEDRGSKIASALGLSMLGDISETMVAKEALGQGFHITPKSSLQNGFYKGLSVIAKEKGHKAAQNLKNRREYLTIEAGREILISLIGRGDLKR